jgi:hypothetical protein
MPWRLLTVREIAAQAGLSPASLTRADPSPAREAAWPDYPPDGHERPARYELSGQARTRLR